jgi:hypothetical protein
MGRESKFRGKSFACQKGKDFSDLNQRLNFVLRCGKAFSNSSRGFLECPSEHLSSKGTTICLSRFSTEGNVGLEALPVRAETAKRAGHYPSLPRRPLGNGFEKPEGGNSTEDKPGIAPAMPSGGNLPKSYPFCEEGISIRRTHGHRRIRKHPGNFPAKRLPSRRGEADLVPRP